MSLQQMRNGAKEQMKEYYRMNVSGEIKKNKKNKAKKNETKPAEVLNTQQKTVLNGSCEDLVNHPDHYASSAIECIDAMEAMVDSQGRNYRIVLTGHMFYLWQVIFKYIWRWPFKEKPIEDLKKAEFYLKKLIKALEKTNYVQK
tara:strand:+ start:436 stop:867 length:432 start_codon:yes stop_codon:yes gene_type:complete